jgi:magnesium-transporting ATPase (P-type)
MGKEGNQAASFADYAIPRFKDLRRALFWHGRPYGIRLVNLVTFCLFKSMIRATALYAIQWENGYSGHQPVEGLMHALFNILLTVWFQLEQSIFDQDVSRVKYGEVEKEANMPYSMSALFAYSRSLCNRKRFLITIGCFDAYSLVVGAIIFYVFFFSQGIMDDGGHIYGVFTYGVTATISVVWIHHFQLFINTRNWTCWLVFWFCLSLAYLPLVCWLGQLSTKIDLTGAIYGELLPSYHLTAIIIVTVAICTLPLYLFKQVH